MNHPAHDKLIAIAKGWQMERSVEDEWVPVRHGDAALDWARAAGWHRIRIAPGQPEVAEPFYISGPYPDGRYSICELATGKVLQRLGADEFPAALRTHAAVAGKDTP